MPGNPITFPPGDYVTAHYHDPANFATPLDRGVNAGYCANCHLPIFPCFGSDKPATPEHCHYLGFIHRASRTHICRVAAHFHG